ncbi:hypothetical protein ABZS66_25525 [Dactylosporangium sp. NPDC005572]|uniref:hypothetical protein n=1 Tax=Dactylosporangium sp. NPDC005572 TaxID=3156889 RepID=UPI0033A7CBEB
MYTRHITAWWPGIAAVCGWQQDASGGWSDYRMAMLDVWLKLPEFGQEVVKVMFAGLLVLDTGGEKLHEPGICAGSGRERRRLQRPRALWQHRPEPAPPFRVPMAEVDVAIRALRGVTTATDLGELSR